MKKVLVTGAGGYVGSVLVGKLIKCGYAVRALDRFFFGLDKLAVSENLEIYKDDSRKINSEIFQDVEFVIDLVAISNDPSAELFARATEQINYKSRVRIAQLAKQEGVKRYILPSSASIYGFREGLLSEASPTNPLTNYARANENAEKGVLELADDDFVVTVIRQATLFGLSPRMRFDLAVNGMTYGAYKNGELPLMRDGNQYRPMLHIQDTTDLMIQLLIADKKLINGEIFNAGDNDYNFKIKDLALEIARIIQNKNGRKIEIKWYGDPDRRSYRLDFTKINKKLNWKVKYTIEDGVTEILIALEKGSLTKVASTITLEWYRILEDWFKKINGNSDCEDEAEFEKWKKIIDETVKYGGILNINNE